MIDTAAAPTFSSSSIPAFLKELKHCWADPRAFAHHDDARTLASVRNAGDHGLDRMSPVDQCIASLIFTYPSVPEMRH